MLFSFWVFFFRLQHQQRRTSSFPPGNKRLWVITAPSHNNHYLRMMEKQLEDAARAVSGTVCCMMFCSNFA